MLMKLEFSRHVFEKKLKYHGVRGVLSWFRHCATSRKVTGSIPDVVIGIFN
jgi:hypothetical protein